MLVASAISFANLGTCFALDTPPSFRRICAITRVNGSADSSSSSSSALQTRQPQASTAQLATTWDFSSHPLYRALITTGIACSTPLYCALFTTGIARSSPLVLCVSHDSDFHPLYCALCTQHEFLLPPLVLVFYTPGSPPVTSMHAHFLSR